MNNKLFTAGEIMTIQSNLKKIEDTLHRPIPGGVLDASQLKDHLLSAGEIMTICSNIDKIDNYGKYYYSPKSVYTKSSNFEVILAFTILGFGLLCCIFGWF